MFCRSEGGIGKLSLMQQIANIDQTQLERGRRRLIPPKPRDLGVLAGFDRFWGLGLIANTADMFGGKMAWWPESKASRKSVADREGFEPSVGFHLHTLSKRARSTTPPPVRFHDVAV